MNIMYAYDENYIEIAAVSILSCIQNNTEEELHFYLIQDNVVTSSTEKMKEMIHSHNADVTFIEKPDIRKLSESELKTLRWSDSAFSRLFLKELFGNEITIDKLLYIDCDTLIVGSLQELWETNIDDWLGAACLECMSNWHKRIIGAKPKDNYINTGMLLLNVKRWIDEDIQSLEASYIRKHKGKIEYVDQGVINGTISNRFKLVSPKYNLTALAYDFTYEEMQIYRKPQFGYSKEEWESALSDPRVVHFTTSFLSIRPWFEGSRHPYAEEWKRVHDETPWKNVKYKILKDREKRIMIEHFYRKLPNSLAIRISGILHSYIKPIIYMLSR